MTKQFRKIPSTVTFGKEVITYLNWCSTRYTKTTNKAKYWILARLYQETGIPDLKHLTNELVDEHLAKIAKHGAGPIALNRVMSQIRCIVNWYREMGRNDIPIKLMLLQRVKVQEFEQVFYTREQIAEVAKRAKDPTVKLMISICFDSGMRASELARLQRSEIHGQRLRFATKGGSERETYVTKRTATMIKNYILANDIKDFLFPGNHEGHIAYNTLHNRMQKPFYAAGMTDFHIHALRHSYVADLERRGATTEEIFVLIGHKNLKTTIHYQHRIKSSEYKRELLKKYHKWR